MYYLVANVVASTIFSQRHLVFGKNWLHCCLKILGEFLFMVFRVSLLQQSHWSALGYDFQPTFSKLINKGGLILVGTEKASFACQVAVDGVTLSKDKLRDIRVSIPDLWRPP